MFCVGCDDFIFQIRYHPESEEKGTEGWETSEISRGYEAWVVAFAIITANNNKKGRWW